MIKLPDFSKSVDFKHLKDQMGVTKIPELPLVEFKRTIIKRNEFVEPNTEAIERERTLNQDSIPSDLAEILPDEKGLLTYKGRKVVAYIRDQRKGVNYYRGYSKYRYHLCNCSTIRYMRESGRIRRYLVTKRSDGLFTVYDLSFGTPRKFIARLELCQHCIPELRGRRIYFTPFNLKQFFERFESCVPKTIRRIEEVPEVQTYSPNHDQIAREYKKTAKFKCQICTVDCSIDQELLHLHHLDGDPSNNKHSNLRILCIDCHSRQPLHAHVARPRAAQQHILKIKRLRKEQGILEF